MVKFREYAKTQAPSQFILQGNAAFALGVVHAGYHAADGYPGTPSTEVIDKCLAQVQDSLNVGWSVNEAVAVAVGVGHALAGADAVVTMKIPGVFQAGDAITTSAFYCEPCGALVLYVASDYVPSSTQHVIDVRHFFAASRLPVLEPRDHQEMYDIAFTAADISRGFNTPVVVLVSGILAHSEGVVTTKPSRQLAYQKLPQNLHSWMLTPHLARINYDKVAKERIPKIAAQYQDSALVKIQKGPDPFTIITCGESTIIVREALNQVGLNPTVLSLALTYPLPQKPLREVMAGIKDKVFIFEDGDRFLQDKIELQGLKLIGKSDTSTITNWTPKMVLEVLDAHLNLNLNYEKNGQKTINAPPRPPTICPGCPYRAFGLSVAKLKKRKIIYAAFGEIGCSTLLYFLNSIDTVMCMGASDSIRQGFTLARPDMSAKTISVIGDSCECHSGLDSTRNAIFRNSAGVKVILDNRVTAMTGGQPAPTSPTNLAGKENRFNLKEVLEAEQARTIEIDAFDIKAIEASLLKALDQADKGEFSALILKGSCIQETPKKLLKPTLTVAKGRCKKCGLCKICPGIAIGDDKIPFFTNLCTNCGSNKAVCAQICPQEALVAKGQDCLGGRSAIAVRTANIEPVSVPRDKLPPSLRVAIRGIGGQGNLFFGKVLSQLALSSPYRDENIVKGDTHGMAQLGGAVISTFGCGVVYSPILAPGSVDILVSMELSEVLRDDFLELLRPQGTIILNQFQAIPLGSNPEAYPKPSEIDALLSSYKVIKVDANKKAYDCGDVSGRSANVIVLGLLSTLTPFSHIPKENWLAALMAVSSTDSLKSLNRFAFETGREL